jgi:hypothetical protein
MGDYQQYLPSQPKPSQQQGSESHRERFDEGAIRGWEVAFRESPVHRLRYLDALLARTTDPLQVERIKHRAGELIREVGATAVLSDPSLISMVRLLFGVKGLERLRERAKTEQVQR